MRIPALDRKLLRDLRGMKGQAFAIGLVLASGSAMYVTYLSNFDSLRRTQAAYYDRFRFADVFASCKRAPLRLEERLAAIPGVTAVEARVVVDVTLDLPGVAEPVKGRLISVPAERRPALNDLFLRRGRWIEAGRSDEVLVNEAFALARRLEPGDRFAALVNGRRQILRVAGHALSPEYVYVLPPGEVIPDDGRFGVVWMERRALAAAFDMEGGFNDVALKLMPGASEPEVVARPHRLLRPWGGLGAVPRRLQTSHCKVEVGAAYFPALDEMIAAATGLGCWWNGRPARVSPITDLKHSYFTTTSVQAFEKHKCFQVFRRLMKSCYYQTGWSDAYGYLLVATGRVELMLDPLMNPWDCGPFPPILQEAGGYFVDWRGDITIHAGEALATTQTLLPNVLKLLEDS